MTPEARADFIDLMESGTMPPKRRCLLRAVWSHIKELEEDNARQRGVIRNAHDALVREGFIPENAGAGCAYGAWTAAHYVALEIQRNAEHRRPRKTS